MGAALIKIQHSHELFSKANHPKLISHD